VKTPTPSDGPSRPPGRERVLHAAIEAFGERGYEGASISDIASRAGVAKSVIYHHFESKAGLYEALIEAESQALIASVAEVLPSPIGDVTRATRLVVDAYLGFIEARPESWRLLVRDAPAGADLMATHARFQRERSRALLELFPEVARGDERKRLYVELLSVALRAFANWWYDHREAPRGVVVDAVMDFAQTTGDRLAEAPSGPRRDP